MHIFKNDIGAVWHVISSLVQCKGCKILCVASVVMLCFNLCNYVGGQYGKLAITHNW